MKTAHARIAAFTGEHEKSENNFGLDNSGNVFVFDYIARHYTRHHSLTDAQRSYVRTLIIARHTFLKHFACFVDALDFEEAQLAKPKKELPSCALAVVNYNDPTPRYWVWLTVQHRDENV